MSLGYLLFPKLVCVGHETPILSKNNINFSPFFSCWLDFSNGLIWAFGAPVACVLVVNSVMFMIAICIARKSIQKIWMAIMNMTELTTRTHAKGAPKAHIKPLLKSSQQLKKRREINVIF